MILITGGAGFIGSNIAAKLAADNEDVVICDWLGKSNKWMNLQQVLLSDIIQPEMLDSWLAFKSKEITAVVHMGAVSSTTEQDVDLLIKNNYQLSVTLWQFCSANNIPFIYASSAATYGDGKQGFSDDTEKRGLLDLKPINPYGWSKHLFDLWVLRQVEKNLPHPPKWAGLKFFNVYGQNEYHKGSMQSIIAQKHRALAAGGTLQLFKSGHRDYLNGEQKRDFIYIKDCVDIVQWMISSNFTSGIYNIGSGTAKSWNEVASSMFSALGLELKVEYIDMPPHLHGKYQYFTKADINKLEATGCPVKFHSLEEGVTDYIVNFLNKKIAS
jgi:ADP-L-glycero-D-manno-heptose 6-epimerase